MSKRGNSEGSVFQFTQPGRPTRWRAQLTIDGRNVTRTRDTQKEAIEALKQLRREADTGVVVRGDLTVSDICEEWRKVDQADSNRTHGTIKQNDGHLRAWKDTIGSKHVAKLTVRDVEAAMRTMNEKRGKPYGRETFLKRKSVLGLVFDAAIRRGDVVRNPARLARIPGDATRMEARRSFTPEQANAIIEATANQRNGAVYLLGLTLGLRPGELFGLRWDALDLRRGTLHVQRSVKMETGRPVVTDSLKTKGSLRTLKLPGFVLDALRVHRDRQAAEVKPVGYVDHGLMFPNPNGGPIDLGHFRDCFIRTTKSLGLGDDWTPNEMRHTAASLLAHRGVALELIADILGHKTTRMVEQHYRHGLRPEMDAHVDAMESIFTKRTRKRRTV